VYPETPWTFTTIEKAAGGTLLRESLPKLMLDDDESKRFGIIDLGRQNEEAPQPADQSFGMDARSKSSMCLFAVVSVYDGSLRGIFDSKHGANHYIEMVERYAPHGASDCRIEERMLNSHEFDS